MTFSEEARSEISRSLPDKPCCRMALLSALLYGEKKGKAGWGSASWVASTTHAGEARLILSLLKEAVRLPAYWEVRKDRFRKINLYDIFIPSGESSEAALRELGLVTEHGRPIHRIPARFLRRSCCRRQYFRGVFLASGSVTAPRKSYHAEILIREESYGKDLEDLGQKLSFSFKSGRRRKAPLLYLKKAEEIALLLNTLGAHQSLLQFEEVRAIRETKNDVHRLVNCETANLSKVAGASLRMVKKIEFLRKKVGLSRLPCGLKEMARARLKYQQVSLKELGERFSPPLSKSSVQHRLARLEEMADREMKNSGAKTSVKQN